MHYIVYAEEETEGSAAMEVRIVGLMSKMGISAHLKGYRYIKTAVRRCMVDSEELEGITKRLYPGVAREHHTTAGRVEHGIRHAVEIAWKKDNHEIWERLFGYSLHQANRKPTNGEVIATMADYLTINNDMWLVDGDDIRHIDIS